MCRQTHCKSAQNIYIGAHLRTARLHILDKGTISWPALLEILSPTGQNKEKSLKGKAHAAATVRAAMLTHLRVQRRISIGHCHRRPCRPIRVLGAKTRVGA